MTFIYCINAFMNIKVRFEINSTRELYVFVLLSRIERLPMEFLHCRQRTIIERRFVRVDHPNACSISNN